MFFLALGLFLKHARALKLFQRSHIRYILLLQDVRKALTKKIFYVLSFQTRKSSFLYKLKLFFLF